MRRFEKGNVVKETSDPKKALAYLSAGYQETTESKPEPKKTDRRKKAADEAEAAQPEAGVPDEQPAE